MAFHVPTNQRGFFQDVELRFRLLLRKGIITGIDPMRLSNWLVNFVSPEDKYLAAHLLNGLTYRSHAMVKSSFQHLMECELPRVLREHGGWSFADLETIYETLSNGTAQSPIRIVAVDGTFENTPGKSGAVMIRQFKRHLNVARPLLCRPERLEELPENVKVLIFIDDLVGSGQQFNSFAKHYNLEGHSKNRCLVYCPLLAFDKGLNKLNEALPWLKILAVETLNSNHQFFRGSVTEPHIWGIDQVNTVQDVKDHVKMLCERNDIPAETRHCLDLLVAFEHAVPNNSLPMLSIRSAKWEPLFDR